MEGNIDVSENINRLPFLHALTWTKRPHEACADRESNLQPFGLQDSAQPTEPHKPGTSFYNCIS